MDFGHMHSTGAQNKTFISNSVLLLGAFITGLPTVPYSTVQYRLFYPCTVCTLQDRKCTVILGNNII